MICAVLRPTSSPAAATSDPLQPGRMGRWLASVLLAAVLAGCAAPPADAPPVVAHGPSQALSGPAGAQADSPPDSGVSAPPRARKEGRVRSAPSSPREADTA